MTNSLRHDIANLPGADGWWKSRNEGPFVELAERLSSLGVSDDEIMDILNAIYSAVAGEFGN